MPSKSAKQARTMRAAANNSDFAKKVGIPQKVAREFESADEGKRFKKGSGHMPNKKDGPPFGGDSE